MQATEIRPDETFDLIVVGAGVGGSILAARIAQFGVNPRNGERLKIGLFEQGPYLLKGGPRRGYGAPERRSKLTNLPGEIPFIGPLVGGDTTHAGMISYPIMPIDYIHYREATGVDWTWEAFESARNEMYEMWHPYPEPEEIRAPGQQRFREVALAHGHDVHEAGIAKLNCVRCGTCNSFLCKFDSKSSALTTYIPIAEREGVRIIPKARVEKVILEKKASRPVATGVVYKYDGDLRRAFAGKVILSCAGASMEATPSLLYRSGYGPREKVQAALVVENRNVGYNRSGSVRTHVEALFDEPIKHPDISVHGVYYTLKHLGPGGYNWLMVCENLGFREGPYPTELAFTDVAPQFGLEHKQYMKKAMRHWGDVRVEVNKNLVRPRNDEEEKLFQTREGLARHHPVILEGIREGQQIAYKILKDMGATKITGHEDLPESFSISFDTSVCRAGASPENSVVNSDLECHDIDNLFICDRSVPPCQATGNVTMPLAAIANYGWRRIVGKYFSA